jgi:NADPH-dependent curcumin reductase
MPTNLQVVLAKRPGPGPLTTDCFSLREAPLVEPDDGQIRVKLAYVSLDPAMRGWVNDTRSYMPPVGIGEVMRAYAAGYVESSRHPDFKEGDAVQSVLGVQQYAVVKGGGRVIKVDTTKAPLERWVGGLGMPGWTAYFGLLEVGQPKDGETVVVSAASGAVGSVVGQIAKIKGCRAVGIAGGPDKCRYVTDELGFDACVDYKAGGDLTAAVKAACPDGVDVYFDNVGGPILDTLLLQRRLFSRIVLCGLISDYNATETYGIRHIRAILTNRVKMQGMIVFDWKERYAEALTALAGAQLKTRESVVEGLENAPKGLIALLKGENFGKQLVRLA